MSNGSDDGIPPRRNARSLDLDNSPAKAAAWVWHLHASKPDRSNEGGRFVLHNRRRSSADHKDSRFRLEAAAAAAEAAAAAAPLKTGGKPPHESMPAASFWDCGSKLYDTFELVSFSNRLDRSLLGVPAFQAPNSHHTQSPLHQPGGVLRTLSLPRRMPLEEATTIRDDRSNDKTSPLMATNNVRQSFIPDEKAPNYKKSFSSKWPSLAKLVKIFKKVVSVHNRMRCMECKKPVSPKLKQLGPSAAEVGDQLKYFKQCLAVEGEMKHQYQHFYHHSYVHHHHHHYLHRLGPHESKEAGLKDFKPPIDSQGAWSPRAESARLSSETMSKICADKNWF